MKLKGLQRNQTEVSEGLGCCGPKCRGQEPVVSLVLSHLLEFGAFVSLSLGDAQ